MTPTNHGAQAATNYYEPKIEKLMGLLEIEFKNSFKYRHYIDIDDTKNKFLKETFKREWQQFKEREGLV